MKDIDRVPVSIMHTYTDYSCPPETLEYTYSAMTVEEKFIIWENGDHNYFFFETGNEMVTRVSETIDYG